MPKPKLDQHIRTLLNNLDTNAGELIDYFNDTLDPTEEDHNEMKYHSLMNMLDMVQDKVTSIQEDQGWI